MSINPLSRAWQVNYKKMKDNYFEDNDTATYGKFRITFIKDEFGNKCIRVNVDGSIVVQPKTANSVIIHDLKIHSPQS